MKKITYKKILVTHDGSLLATSALPHALSLAEQLNTKIVLLRVVGFGDEEAVLLSPTGMIPPMPPAGETAEKIVRENKKMAEEQLQRIKMELEGSGARWVEAKVTEGIPDKEIVAKASAEHIDLIIMSTHGRSGLGRALLGSVADAVVRHASCPVLLVHPSSI